MQEMAQHATGSMYKFMSEVMDCRSTPAGGITYNFQFLKDQYWARIEHLIDRKLPTSRETLLKARWLSRAVTLQLAHLVRDDPHSNHH